MRTKRIRKFRSNNWVYMFSMKTGIIFYSLILTIFYLTGSTGAFFNDYKTTNSKIEIGTWEEPWDKSSLKFVASKCECYTISATIKNSGDRDIKGPVAYEVWYAAKGNPKSGSKIYSGEIKALKSGESLKLSYTANKNGIYMFKALQRPGHPGKGELWSEGITAKSCDKTKSNEASEVDTPVKEEKSKNEDSKKNEPSVNTETIDQTPNAPVKEAEEIKEPVLTEGNEQNTQSVPNDKVEPSNTIEKDDKKGDLK
ncbi:amyloid fiber anchoring/assembly protein TapA [Fictibacillus sp. JL2B1089]|uniref:amyloid fiber anchoring/assembly protein TapA n=1 Tax=Fictibacillus sp. JL2B1089 TaxID=3399565 RepID=UPI003A89087D